MPLSFGWMEKPWSPCGAGGQNQKVVCCDHREIFVPLFSSTVTRLSTNYAKMLINFAAANISCACTCLFLSDCESFCVASFEEIHSDVLPSELLP